jgi:hypothetical protein
MRKLASSDGFFWKVNPRLENVRLVSNKAYVYCNEFAGSIHDGSLLHSKFNTQLLITVSNFFRILAHVQLLLVLEQPTDYTPKVDTLQLITISSSSRILTHVRQILGLQRKCVHCLLAFQPFTELLIKGHLFSLLR